MKIRCNRFLAAILAVAFAFTAGAVHAASNSSAAGAGVRLVQARIPLRDGVMLAATLYMPANLRANQRVPALLEYLPYRKDDDTLPGDYAKYAYFARHGYVGARVDIRGFGNSGGRPPTREYSAVEQEDGEQVIAWLARQPWSNGNVGMLGISWGGFNSIQMAMRRPPALKAILAIAATEALFKEDVHYMDGLMHVDEFEVAMDLDQGRSGGPDFALDEDTLARRMDSTPWSLDYFRHQRDGAFWRAPISRFEDIRIPCFLIGGLQDGYRDSIPRMLEHVSAPVHAWVGPWNHDYPNESMYGPKVEWRDQAVRWFDHWLKGIDNGVEREPRLVIYEQHSRAPGNSEQDVPGEWRTESWPVAGLKPTTWYLAANHQLDTAPATPATDHLVYVPSAGTEAGFWWGELLPDQRGVDAYSLVYDSTPLDAPVSMLGFAHLKLAVTADAPLADWMARLEDVAPNGQVTAITGAGIAGAQRHSMENPQPLEPGQEVTLDFDLHLSTWVWEPGHRIRLAVSNAQWPMIWPTPYAMTTSLRLGGTDGSTLVLPLVPLKGGAPPVFGNIQPDEAPPGISTLGDYAWPGTWEVERDIAHQSSKVNWHGTSAYQFPWGTVNHSEQILYTTDDAHPALSKAQGESETIEKLKDRELIYRGHLTVTSDATLFHSKFTRELLRDGTVLRTKTWVEDIPRDLQ
jgi:uncharacterized protein